MRHACGRSRVLGTAGAHLCCFQFNALNINVANMPKRSVRELMQERVRGCVLFSSYLLVLLCCYLLSWCSPSCPPKPPKCRSACTGACMTTYVARPTYEDECKWRMHGAWRMVLLRTYTYDVRSRCWHACIHVCHVAMATKKDRKFLKKAKESDNII